MLTSNDLDLSNTMAVPQDNTNLRRSCAFPGELADIIFDLLGSRLEPCWDLAGVGYGGGTDTLALAVKTTHFVVVQ